MLWTFHPTKSKIHTRNWDPFSRQRLVTSERACSNTSQFFVSPLNGLCGPQCWSCGASRQVIRRTSCRQSLIASAESTVCAAHCGCASCMSTAALWSPFTKSWTCQITISVGAWEYSTRRFMCGAPPGSIPHRRSGSVCSSSHLDICHLRMGNLRMGLLPAAPLHDTCRCPVTKHQCVLSERPDTKPTDSSALPQHA